MSCSNSYTHILKTKTKKSLCRKITLVSVSVIYCEAKGIKYFSGLEKADVNANNFEDVPLVEFTFLVFTCMPDERYCR